MKQNKHIPRKSKVETLTQLLGFLGWANARTQGAKEIHGPGLLSNSDM